jgi:hypothetical protein
VGSSEGEQVKKKRIAPGAKRIAGRAEFGWLKQPHVQSALLLIQTERREPTIRRSTFDIWHLAFRDPAVFFIEKKVDMLILSDTPNLS